MRRLAKWASAWCGQEQEMRSDVKLKVRREQSKLFFLNFNFLLVYINCTKGFQCGIFIPAYIILWSKTFKTMYNLKEREGQGVEM
jgi:hypothetical protein